MAQSARCLVPLTIAQQAWSIFNPRVPGAAAVEVCRVFKTVGQIVDERPSSDGSLAASSPHHYEPERTEWEQGETGRFGDGSKQTSRSRSG